jgi:hypothetical protein
MTLMDRPTPTLRPVTSPPSVAPATPGGRYVTSIRPQPVSEGTYVTTTAPVSAPESRERARNSYVTSTMPTVRLGGRYTYSN